MVGVAPLELPLPHTEIPVNEGDAPRRPPREARRLLSDALSRLLLVPVAPEVAREIHVRLLQLGPRQGLVPRPLLAGLSLAALAGVLLGEGEGVLVGQATDGGTVIPLLPVDAAVLHAGATVTELLARPAILAGAARFAEPVLVEALPT